MTTKTASTASDSSFGMRRCFRSYQAVASISGSMAAMANQRAGGAITPVQYSAGSSDAKRLAAAA